MIYDSHTHLNSDKLYENREQHYQDFLNQWWKWLITVGMDPHHNLRAIEIAEKTATHDVPVKITLWIHPYEVGNWSVLSKKDVDKQIILIKEQYKQYKQHIVAIWEWWIDAYYNGYETWKEAQFYAFDQQCKLAQELHLPIVIHSRDQFEDTFAIIKNYPDLKVYYHCFWYGPEAVIKLSQTFDNLRIWFCGNVTYPKAQLLKDSFIQTRELQKQWKCNVLFETDAPYLTPQQWRWSTNSPEKVRGIYEFCSELLWEDIWEIQNIIEQSYLRLYY